MKEEDFMRQATKCLRYMQRRDSRELEFNLNCAKEDSVINDLSFGRLALSIPEQHLEVLKIMYPDLSCVDNEVRYKAWQALSKNELSIPYKPNSKAQRI